MNFSIKKNIKNKIIFIIFILIFIFLEIFTSIKMYNNDGIITKNMSGVISKNIDKMIEDKTENELADMFLKLKDDEFCGCYIKSVDIGSNFIVVPKKNAIAGGKTYCPAICPTLEGVIIDLNFSNKIQENASSMYDRQVIIVKGRLRKGYRNSLTIYSPRVVGYAY